jgi:peptidoglycan/LPS O-acetylase OafA/YrhL
VVALLLALVVAVLALLVAGALALQMPAGRMPVVRTLVAVTLAGGLGGFINAALCFLGWPVEIKGAPFYWHVVPAGFAHGAILALVASTAELVGRRWRRQL